MKTFLCSLRFPHAKEDTSPPESYTKVLCDEGKTSNRLQPILVGRNAHPHAMHPHFPTTESRAIVVGQSRVYVLDFPSYCVKHVSTAGVE